jgi:hypothetical protein
VLDWLECSLISSALSLAVPVPLLAARLPVEVVLEAARLVAEDLARIGK